MDVQGAQSGAQVMTNWIANEHISYDIGFLQGALTLQPFPCSGGSKGFLINTKPIPGPGQIKYGHNLGSQAGPKLDHPKLDPKLDPAVYPALFKWRFNTC